MTVIDSFRLDGQVALLTGAAGSFGRQIAEALGEAGARTFVASRDVGKLEGFAADLRERGFNVTALPLDQSDERSILQLKTEIVQRAGGLDILVNNAVLRPMSGFDATAADFSRSMEVNATGVFLMTRTFGQLMAEQGHGSIINVSSIQGMVGPDLSLYEGLGWGVPPDYFFHKGGMLQLTRYAAALLGPKGVRVNTISPGGFFNEQDERFVTRYNARTFLNRMAGKNDLKGIIVFLASAASAYITGTNIPVDGGYTAK